MDFTFVRTVGDADFQALGLVCQGDIPASKSFVPLSQCKRRKNSKLLKLTHLLGTTSTKSKTASTRGRSSPSVDDSQLTPCKQIQSCKNIQIGWQHYNKKGKRYVGVRLKVGQNSLDLPIFGILLQHAR